jgi:hypothetical protein
VASDFSLVQHGFLSPKRRGSRRCRKANIARICSPPVQIEPGRTHRQRRLQHCSNRFIGGSDPMSYVAPRRPDCRRYTKSGTAQILAKMSPRLGTPLERPGRSGDPIADPSRLAGDCDDPGLSLTGAGRPDDRPADRSRRQDGAQVHRSGTDATSPHLATPRFEVTIIAMRSIGIDKPDSRGPFNDASGWCPARGVRP